MSVKRPTVAHDEHDLSYTDKLSGRRLAFTPTNDEAVVTFHRPPSERDISESIGGTPLGSEQLINTYTVSSQTSPSVAVETNGDFVVAWSSYGQAVQRMEEARFMRDPPSS